MSQAKELAMIAAAAIVKGAPIKKLKAGRSNGISTQTWWTMSTKGGKTNVKKLKEEKKKA